MEGACPIHDDDDVKLARDRALLALVGSFPHGEAQGSSGHCG